MANSLLTMTQVTREALRLFKNTNAFISNLDTQYDGAFAQDGAKIGTALRIRLPSDYIVRSGPTAVIQDTVQNYITLNVTAQRGVDVSFSSVDKTMSLQNYSDLVLQPAMNALAGQVAVEIMQGAEGGVNHLVASFDTNNNLLSATNNSWLQAGAILTNNGESSSDRRAILDPFTMARTANNQLTLFNPQREISGTYRDGMMGHAFGMDFYEDQTVIKHTTGAYGTAPTVAGAGQTGTTLTVTATNGPINAGDVFSIAGVVGVNRVNKQSNGTLRQFVATANVPAGSTSIPIYPAIIPQAAGANVSFQTVLASPANGAAVVFVMPAGSTFRKNIVYGKQAITMATADLVLPRGSVEEAARQSFGGVSMRMATQWLYGTDQFATRLDLLFGFLFMRPEWAVAVADII